MNVRGRWRLRCVGVDGVVRYEAGYLLRRNAIADAERLASPLYDVVVDRRDGTERTLVNPHIPASELLAGDAGTQRPGTRPR